MAAAHLIHGYIGAGKTTFARQLERELGAVRFSHDEWMSRLYGADSPAALFAGRHGRVTALMTDVWTRCLDLGVDVVLDLGFWSRAERDEARRTAAGRHADVRLYRLQCADEVARARVARRNLDLQGELHIAPATFESLKARFEPLAADEERIDVAD